MNRFQRLTLPSFMGAIALAATLGTAATAATPSTAELLTLEPVNHHHQPAQNKQTQKKRIVILDFYYGNTSDTGYWSSYRGGAASTGISELVSTALVEGAKYRIADRSLVAGSNTGEVSVAQAVALGKKLGVDAVIIGTVTQFTVESQRSSGGVFGVGGNSEQNVARVKLNVRIVDTATGDILGVAKGEGEANSSGGGGSLFGVGGSTSATDGGTLLNRAVDEAVKKLVEDLQNKY